MRRLILSTALLGLGALMNPVWIQAQTDAPPPPSAGSTKGAGSERPKDAAEDQPERTVPAAAEQLSAYRAESGGIPHAEEGAAGAPFVDPKAYIIGPSDFLRISVWREAELSGERSVRPDGMVSLPLINEIRAAGYTPEQLATVIKDRLAKFILRPLVTVSVQQVNSKKYYIQGEVQKPGVFPLVEPTTVLEALGNAGGFKEFANTKNVLILRGAQRFKFNYKSARDGKNTEQNISLQNGDQIIVR